MKRRDLLAGLAAAAAASGCTSQAPRRAQASPAPGRAQPSPAPYASPVPLPPPQVTGTISLELYAVTAQQVMHYLPDGHRAETRAVSDLRPELQAAALGQSSVGAAPVVIAVTAVPGRLSHRYGAKAGEYAQIEVGHASQNILLQAAALGLGAVPVGSLDPARVAATLALPPDQTVLYLIPVGHVP